MRLNEHSKTELDIIINYIRANKKDLIELYNTDLIRLNYLLDTDNDIIELVISDFINFILAKMIKDNYEYVNNGKQ